MRLFSLVVLTLLLACTPGRPAFPEPAWGDAPPPRTEEITEITFDHLFCDASKCGREVVVLRRNGGALREFFTRSQQDSTQRATIDSATFVEIVLQLRSAGFFDGREIEQREHGPTAVDSWIVSAATYCRRRVRTYESHPELRPRPWLPGFLQTVTERVEGMQWMRIIYRA